MKKIIILLMAGLMIMPACYRQPIINIPEIKIPAVYQLKNDDHFSRSDYIALCSLSIAVLNFFVNAFKKDKTSKEGEK